MVDKPLLQKRAIRLINFSPKCEHAIPFFVNLNSGCSFSLCRICFLFNVWCPKQASPCSYSKCIYPCLRYPLLQHQISNYTDKFYVMSSHLEQLNNSFSRFGVRLWNALPENIKKSARRNVFKKKIHETLINIFKQENLYLTPSSILEIIKTCKTVILQLRPV